MAKPSIYQRIRTIHELLLEHYGDGDWWRASSADEVVIGAVLTQNTNWLNVEKALANLRSAGLLSKHRAEVGTAPSLSSIAAMPGDILAALIRPAGYHNIKARRLQAVAKHLCCYIPPSDTDEFRRYLLACHGIGKETADSILLYGFGRIVFVIDAYTIRLFSRLGLISPDISYDEAQQVFQRALPQDLSTYTILHANIVIHSKTLCHKRPLCPDCFLQNHCLWQSRS
ncbi:MAG: endonuclease [Candidatus Cloacimonetes bacterium]|nr:endonuclease [Candidatus Cloacimonadota bacterium]